MTIQQIAKELSISPTSISFILNGKADRYKISKQTQERVLDYLKEHNYQPNALARSLASGKTYTIGYIVPNIADAFFARIARGIEDAISRKGYQIIMASTDENPEDEQRVVQNLLARHIDGVIVAPTLEGRANMAELESAGIPIVFFDRDQPNIKAHYVGTTNRRSARDCVCQMIDSGARRIAIVSIPPEAQSVHERVEGYKEALESRGLEIDDSLYCFIDPCDLKASLTTGLERILELSPAIDGMFFTNDIPSYDGYLLLNSLFPERLRKLCLASFDDMTFFEFTQPKITGIAQPEQEISTLCAQLMMESIESGFKKPRRVEVPAQIHWRSGHRQSLIET